MKRDWLTDNVRLALKQARRSAGWNCRRPDVKRFELANRWGNAPCVLYVVPARNWAYRVAQREIAEWEHGDAA